MLTSITIDWEGFLQGGAAYNAVNLALAVLGALLGVVAMIIAVWQLSKTRKAADAAARAASEAASASRGRFADYAVANVQRFLGEAKIFVEHQDWRMAASRVADLADQLAQVVNADRTQAQDWQHLVAELRGWESTFKRIGGCEIQFRASVSRKWFDFLGSLSSQLDRRYGPYAGRPEATGHDGRQGS